MFENIVAYILSAFIIIGALSVVLTKNPVYAVLFLIFTFFNTAGIFVFLKSEFLAMVLVIVYVGAVAVLFLFVVMLVNIQAQESRKYILKYFLLSVLLVLVLGAEFIFLINTGLVGFNNFVIAENINNDINSVKQLGIVVYNGYYYVFIVSALILTVAMIGAVMLSEKENKSNNHTQNVAEQNSRNKNNTIKIVKMNNEEGIR